MPYMSQLQSNIFFCGKFLESLFYPKYMTLPHSVIRANSDEQHLPLYRGFFFFSLQSLGWPKASIFSQNARLR